MASFTHGIGKGLREPCSPYRESYVFGAGLNEPKADNWNCIPVIVGPTTSFDLSTISPGREVVAALLGISETPAGDYAIRFRWYRERGDALLYDYTFNYTALSGGWIYGYSYIGYLDWEINENGSYRVEITVSGASSYSKTLYFTVSGIPVIEPAPPPSTGFMAPIIAGLNNIAYFFHFIYLEVNGWPWPFWLIGSHLYGASTSFSELAWRFYDFSEWVNTITDQVLSVLNWETVWSYILSYVPNLEKIRDWFYYWWTWVDQRITDWWSSTSTTVLGWIDEAKQDVLAFVNTLETLLASLQSAWDDFKGRIPMLDQVIYWWSDWTGYVLAFVNTWWTSTMGEVQSLINSAFIVRESLWAGWQEWRDKVTEFFTDPEDWLYKSADRIIERFW